MSERQEGNVFGSLVLFVLASFGVSYIFLVWRPYAPYTQDWPVLARMLLGWGAPMGGCLAALYLRRYLPEDRPTLLGVDPLRNVAMALVPILAILPMGLELDAEMPSVVVGGLLGSTLVGYAVLEEWGWRGFVVERLAIQNRWASALAVTCFWYPWHWWFLGDGSWSKQSLLFGVLYASSLGIGEIGRVTRSVLACAGFHAIGNLLFLSPVVASQLSLGRKGVVLAICVVCWVVLVRGVVQSREAAAAR